MKDSQLLLCRRDSRNFCPPQTPLYKWLPGWAACYLPPSVLSYSTNLCLPCPCELWHQAQKITWVVSSRGGKEKEMQMARKCWTSGSLGSAASGLGARCNPEQNNSHKPSISHGKAGICSDRKWNWSELVQDVLVHGVPNYGQFFQGKAVCRKRFYYFPSAAAKMWCAQAREGMLKQSHAGTPERGSFGERVSL